MRSVIWVLIALCLAGVVVSLGSGLFYLRRGGEEDSAKLARALTVRISLSIAVFVLLLLAWRLGYLAPHPLGGVAPR